MLATRAPMIETSGPETGERREHERARPAKVQSSLGEVIDVSPGGMRVRSRRRPSVERGQAFALDVWKSGATAFRVNVLVVWTRRAGFMRHEIGLQFLNTPAQVYALMNQSGAA